MSASVNARRRAFIVPAVIVLIAVVLVAIAIGRAGGEGTSDATSPGDAPTSTAAGSVIEPETPAISEMARRDPQDPLALGAVDAPVVLVVYSDYQCPFCALWVQDTQPAMLKYVDAGELRIEWRDVNVYGPDSTRASQAAYAAGLQGKLLEYHGGLFAGGHKRNPDELTEGALVDLAKSLDLDVARFTTDLNSTDVAAAVQVNADEGASIGAFSTPTFLIGTQPVIGAQPTAVFVDAIEVALAQARG